MTESSDTVPDKRYAFSGMTVDGRTNIDVIPENALRLSGIFCAERKPEAEMDDFIKYFRKLNSIGGKDKAKTPEKPKPTLKPTEQAELAKNEINRYRQKYAGVDVQVLSKLIALKDITREPKQDNPEQAYEQIKHYLGDAESAETLRQERWPDKIHCPFCNSTNVKQLKPAQQKNKYIHKYQCLDCHEIFNDDSGSTIEKNVPPIHTWMMCWYLLGCTNSIQFIANKLGLDLAMVEMMILHMQKLFKANQPLTNFMSFDEWALVHGKSYKSIMQAALAKKSELYSGYKSSLVDGKGVESDTAETRRQKQRAEDPHKRTPGTPRPRNRGF